jgi:hypothetical protein
MMDKKTIIAELIECADMCDEQDKPEYANELTKLAEKYAQFDEEDFGQDPFEWQDEHDLDDDEDFDIRDEDLNPDLGEEDDFDSDDAIKPNDPAFEEGLGDEEVLGGDSMSPMDEENNLLFDNGINTDLMDQQMEDRMSGGGGEVYDIGDVKW